MRSRVTVDPDVEGLIRTAMKRSGASFKETLDEAVRAGLRKKTERPSKPVKLPALKMGFNSDVRLDKALALAAVLEDEEIARKLSLRK